jgi:hypothetical protein
MPKIAFFALLFCSLLCGGGARAGAQSTHRRLDQTTVIQGYSCAKGYAWFFANGQLNRCIVAQETAFGEARIPAGSYIALFPNGSPNLVQMSHDAPVLGLTCQGGSWLGVGEASVVAFYPSGKLKTCSLASDQTIQGVPCAKGGFFATLTGPDPSVYFYENGKLGGCRLASDYAGLGKGALWRQLNR